MSRRDDIIAQSPHARARALIIPLLLLPLAVFAAGTANNQATSPAGSGASLQDSGIVSVTGSAAAVSSAVAEIAPITVAVNSTGNAFTYDVLPTIGAGNTGVNRIAITAPAGYSNLGVTSVLVGGAPQTLNCPTPGAGEYCASTGGQTMTVTLGAKVTVSLTNIRVGFNADAPGATGSADFTSTVDDSATGEPAQATSAGDADGDAADANTQTVTVTPTTLNWVGPAAGNTNFNNPVNWSPNATPTAAHSCVIDNFDTFQPEVSTNATCGSLTLGTAATTMTLTFSGSANLTIANDVTIGNNGRIAPAAVQTNIFNVGGNWSDPIGIANFVTPNNLRLEYNFTGAGKTISSDEAFYDLDIDGSIALSSDLTVVRDLTISNTNSLTHGANTLTFTPLTGINPTFNINGAYNYTCASTVVINGTGAEKLTMSGGDRYPNVVINNGGHLEGGNPTYIDCDLTVNAGGTIELAVPLYLAGDYINNGGTLICGTGNFIMTGVGARIRGTAPSVWFHHLTIGDGAGDSVTAETDIQIAMALNVTAGASFTLQAGNNIDITAGTATIDGSMYLSGTSTWSQSSMSDAITVSPGGFLSAQGTDASNRVTFTRSGAGFYEMILAGGFDFDYVNIEYTESAGNANTGLRITSGPAEPIALDNVAFNNIQDPSSAVMMRWDSPQTLNTTGVTFDSSSYSTLDGDVNVEAIQGVINFANFGGNFAGEDKDNDNGGFANWQRAVTSAAAEIDPTAVSVGSVGNAFAYDVLPTINVGDSGVDEIAITAPAGYTNLTVSSVNVGGAPQALNCPAPGAGQYCANIAGQTMTITLGTRVTVSLTNIRVGFTADAPGAAGSADFTSTVDDTSVPAAPAQSTTPGNADGDAGDANSTTVAVEDNAVTSALAEIAPNSVAVSSVGNAFAYDVLPTINAGDTGIDEIAVTAPAGYTNLTVTAVTVGGGPQALNCPAPGAGQYCAGVAGQTLTVTLGTKVTVSLTNIRIDFTADAPGSTGSAAFTSTVDDTATTASSPQASAAGNADGDAADANSLTVVVDGPAVTSAAAEIAPNAVAVSSIGNAFSYDVLPTINAGDTGVDEIAVTAPAGYTNLTVTAVNVGGAPQALNCPTPGAGQYCAGVAGQTLTVTLGTKVTVSLTNIRIDFTADAPGSGGSSNFTSTVDDTASVFTAQNTVAGNADGDGADANSITVAVQGPAASAVLAEIAPNAIAVSSVGNAFTYDVLPTINAGDTGVDEIAITAPAGYSNLTVTAVSVGGAGQALNCPSPGAGQYCASVAGQTMTVTLGSRVTVSATNLHVDFTADAPGTAGSANFTSTIDDTATALVAAQATVAGNADGDGTDANSINVTVEGNAVTSAASEVAPNLVGSNSVGNALSYDVLPTINAGDSGVNLVAVTAPAGYTNLTVTGVNVGGAPQATNCPSPGAGQYCASVAGQTMTVTLGTKVTVSATNMRIDFTADAPGTAGSADFTATVDDNSTTTIPAQSTLTGDADGDGADANSETVTVEGLAVSAAVAEIDPVSVLVSSVGNAFTYDVLPTINAGDTGVDQLAITAPAGYAGLSVTGVSVGGAAQTLNCPAPGAGQYCANIAGQTMTVTLGTKVTVSATNIRVAFSANAPAVVGPGTFTSTLDDTATTIAAAQATNDGNADGDPADANTRTVAVTTPVPADPFNSTVSVSPAIVLADGSSISTVTVVLRNAANQPLSGKVVTLASNRGGIDTITQPAAVTDVNGVATGTIQSSTVGAATITATVVTDAVVLNQRPEVYFTQGLVLDLVKTANKDEVVIGDIVTYQIELRNVSAGNVVQVKLADTIPPNFKYVAGSARMNGAPMPDPSGNRPRVFDLGTIPAPVDVNGNGQLEQGEPGYVGFSYQLIVGAGARADRYLNTAVAVDACNVCAISNESSVGVTVSLDPLFDLGTIIGKVFNDINHDGQQDPGEEGIAGAMVVLDDGTYALTDEYGRYHFPAVRPGQRLLKINLQTLKVTTGAETSTSSSRVLTITPGLLVKANFGVIYVHDSETIGRAGQLGVIMLAQSRRDPVEVVGNAEAMTLLVNGIQTQLSSDLVTFGVTNLSDSIEIKSDRLDNPVEFEISVEESATLDSWSIRIYDATGAVAQILKGRGQPRAPILWDGRTLDGELVTGGELYSYQLDVRLADGQHYTGPRRVFGVNRTSAVSMSLTGSAFDSGSVQLNAAAQQMLLELADTLRTYPDEKVIIAGHTDSVGPTDTNMALSQQRAEAAVDFLVAAGGLPRERFIAEWYGETRPIASNEIVEGRELNRRVEIRGEFKDIRRADVNDQYRAEASAIINGSAAPVDEHGRFYSTLDDADVDVLSVTLTDSQGQAGQAYVVIPRLEILEPSGEMRLAYGEHQGNTAVNGKPLSARGEGVLITTRIIGRTDFENTVEIDGTPVTVERDGTFSAELTLRPGGNAVGITARNPEGYTRVASLIIDVADRDTDGRLLVAVRPIPNLTVKLPPKDVALLTQLLTVSGVTTPGNQVSVNGQAIAVNPAGNFATNVTLPMGKSILRIEVMDRNGDRGVIERKIEVEENHVFLLALADGMVSRLQGDGYLEGAGMQSSSETLTSGRIAYYLKGVVAGKYLVTSAYDSGLDDHHRMFGDLENGDSNRLLANLDPDKIYPVYGDASTLVYDAQSHGRFYLAVESEELKALVGNYQLNLDESELTTYQRTLHGGHATYESAERTSSGQSKRKIELFAADGDQGHVQDELRATGGSLYYLSHGEVTEGSEQVILVIRDKNTGLTLARLPQTAHHDYTIKYDQGRILFNRPLASFAADSLLIDSALLSGNPVFIQVDYEYRLDIFERTAAGGRVRQQVGDRLGVGVTYIQDQLETGDYELQGVDVELRLKKGTRIITEFASSSGRDSSTFVSTDGGLSFTEISDTAPLDGEAWKVALEIDAGEWLDNPGRYLFGAYVKDLAPGFRSNDNFLDRGHEKSGANATWKLTDRDTVRTRVDIDKDSDTVPGDVEQSSLTTLQWEHRRERWALTTEFQASSSETSTTTTNASFMAARLDYQFSRKLAANMEIQETLDGQENNQTTIGLDYQLFSRLSLTASATSATTGSAADFGATLMLGNGQRIYFTERFTDTDTDRTTTTVVGSDARLGGNGRIYTEYQWDHGADTEGMRSLVGAEQSWDIVEGLRLSLAGEQSEIDSVAAPSRRSALAFGITYADGDKLRASSRTELRRDIGTEELHQFLTTNHLELKLDPDYTALGKARYSTTRNETLDQIEAEFEEFSIGLAYRPVASDRFNALARYTRISEFRPLTVGGLEAEDISLDVASIEWSYEVNTKLEWVEKDAFKVKTDRTGDRPEFTSNTWLSIHRLNYHLSPTLDLAAEFRTLTQQEADDSRQGWLSELTWQAARHARLGLGYNFTDFSDNEFSDNNYSVQGWFLRIQAVY